MDGLPTYPAIEQTAALPETGTRKAACMHVYGLSDRYLVCMDSLRCKMWIYSTWLVPVTYNRECTVCMVCTCEYTVPRCCIYIIQLWTYSICAIQCKICALIYLLSDFVHFVALIRRLRAWDHSCASYMGYAVCIITYTSVIHLTYSVWNKPGNSSGASCVLTWPLRSSHPWRACTGVDLLSRLV